MKKTFRNFRFKLLAVAFLLIAFSCEKDNEIVNEQIIEQGIIEYGISQNDFESSKAFDGILARLNSNNSTISNRTDGTASQLTSIELLERLDLSKGYLNNQDDGKELLSIPVRTQGNYKRVLLSLTRDDFTNSFLLTYPDSTNNKLYYVSSLDGLLLQKVTIQDSGIGITEIFNTIEDSSGTASRSSSSGCTETVYNSCSSGDHSFASGNAMECSYWTNTAGGTPPTVATIEVACGDSGSGTSGSTGSTSGTGSSSSGQTGGTNGSGFNNGDGDGFDGVPPVKGGNSLVDADDCVSNLDCDECNLGPHDIDGDCNLTSDEITINQINNCLGGTLTGNQKNFLLNNPEIAFDAYDEFTITCNPDGQEYLDVVFETFEQFLNGMHKDCQGLAIFRSISKTKDNSTFTQKIWNHFFVLSSTNHLSIQDIDLPGNAGGVVGAQLQDVELENGEVYNDAVVMQMDNTHLDSATSLGFINTFYHELVHAYIISLYHNGTLLTEYPEYTDLKTSIDNLLTDTDNSTFKEAYKQESHNIYTDFIDDLAKALVAYSNYSGISGVDLTYAKKLVWGGLNGNNVFTENLTATEQLEAQTLLAYENFNNTSNAKGTKTCD